MSAAALATAAVCAGMTVKAAAELLTMLEVFSSPLFYMSLAQTRVAAEIPPLAAFMMHNMRLFFLFSLLFWLSGLALALGVWARREWGRRGACWMLYLTAAAALMLLAYPWLVVPKPLIYKGFSVAPEFNSAVKAAAFAARLGAFLCGGLSLWGALALDRGALKSEFR